MGIICELIGISMVDMIDFDKIEEEQEQKTETEKSLSVQNANVPEVATEKRTAESVIEEQRQKNYAEIAKSEKFQKRSTEIDARTVGAKLDKDDNEAYKQELENQYARYELNKKKEALDYRMKLERKTTKEKVKADVAIIKRETALKRYGYLYKPTKKEVLDENGNPLKDENGNIIYQEIPAKDFTPSKFINQTREFANWYNNLSTSMQKLIKTTLKIIFFGGLAAILVWLAVTGVKWLVDSGILVGAA